jgi:hypothetical protein
MVLSEAFKDLEDRIQDKIEVRENGTITTSNYTIKLEKYDDLFDGNVYKIICEENSEDPIKFELKERYLHNRLSIGFDYVLPKSKQEIPKEIIAQTIGVFLYNRILRRPGETNWFGRDEVSNFVNLIEKHVNS